MLRVVASFDAPIRRELFEQGRYFSIGERRYAAATWYALAMREILFCHPVVFEEFIT